MSYNISSIDIVESDGFGLTPEDLSVLDAKVQGFEWKPESWERDGQHGVVATIARGAFPWTGECSGNGFDFLVSTVLPAFEGSADLILCWGRGDSYTGLRVRDHKVTEHHVERRLGAAK
jgi:hypothetical protein